MFKKIFLGVMITGLLAAGAVTSVSAFGQNPPVCPTEPIPADVLGMTAEELRDEIRSGKTIQELFEEKGLDYEEVAAQWLADHQACLDEAVAEGELTEEQAALLQDHFEERVVEGFLFNQMQQFGNAMRSYMHFQTEKLWNNGHGVMGDLLEKLGITFDELQERIQGGESVEDLAEEAGIDLQAMHEERIAEQLERVDQAVEDGKITEEQADRIRERLNIQLENPVPWHMFDRMNDRMHDRMERPFNSFQDGGRPGGAGLSRGNSGGCW